MNKSSRLWAIGAAVLIVLILIAATVIQDAQTVRTPVALPLVNTFDKSPTGFSVQYPETWEYIIPMVGVMVMGPPETLFEGAPGPTFTVQRTLPLSITGSLEKALESYLESGPLRVEGRWQITLPITRTTLEERDARVVEVEGSDHANSPRLHARIIATTADNTFVYLFVISTPVDKQAHFAPTFAAMLATVRILE